MKARVKATGEIIDVKRVTKYDSDFNRIVYYKAENGFSHQEEHLDFKDLTQGKVDVKEKSLHKDKPDYWEELKHQYAGMAMQGILNSDKLLSILGIQKGKELDAMISDMSVKIATTLINRLKEEEK
jgi:hypothetical protein